MAERDPADDGGPRRPGRPRSAAAERAIIQAALALLAEHGVSGLSVEGVAARAGVAKTTIYRRWTDKNELVVDALAQVRGPVVQPPPGRSVREDLVFVLTALRREQTDPFWGQLIQKLIGGGREHPELTDQYLQRVVGPRRERFLEVLRRGVAEGTIRPDADLALAAEVLIAPVLLSGWMPRGPRIRPDQIPALVDLVLAGIGVPAGTRGR